MIPMPPNVFHNHYAPGTTPPATHLCYEVYEQRTLIESGHFTNTDEAHAEEVFIGERFKDAWKSCTIVWYISWSPCNDCIHILLNTFLPNNPHIKLHIIFAKVYKRTTKNKIQELQARGVNIRVMCLLDFRWCFNHFVEPTESFVPWNNMNNNHQRANQWLQDAFI